MLMGRCSNYDQMYRYNNQTYRVDDIRFDMNPRSEFPTHNGGMISLYDYYTTRYKIVTSDLAQPILINRPNQRQRSSNISGDKEIWLVPEMCHMTGLTDAQRDDFRIMKDVGQHTRLLPDQREDFLQKFIKTVNEREDVRTVLSGWGYKIAGGSVHLNARVISREKLLFGGGYLEMVNPHADWTRAALSRKCLRPIQVDNWLFIYPKKDEDIAFKFGKVLQFEAKKIGVNYAKPRIHSLADDRVQTYMRILSDNLKEDVQLVMTLVPQQRADRYAAIKKMCYVDKPVASQVIVTRTVQREQKIPAVAGKVALQVNCKLGTYYALALLRTLFDSVVKQRMHVVKLRMHNRVPWSPDLTN